MTTLEEDLHIILGRFINIDAHRQSYALNFAEVRNIFFTELKRDEVFKRLLRGQYLEGSCGDNIKIQMPNEYDCVFKLVLPEASLIEVRDDPEMPGNVIINLKQVMWKIRNEKQNEEILKILKKWVDENSDLKISCVQQWLHSLFTKAITRISRDHPTLDFDYRRLGPAHTIQIYSPLEYSIDFVPGIRLPTRDNKPWIAIPKPLKQLTRNQEISFRASFFELEHAMLNHKQNLKNTLRLMKKWRDTQTKIPFLKSYFIKTLFLWKVQEVDDLYWRLPLSTLILDMFRELRLSIENQQLNFMWDDRLNLYGDLKDSQLWEMLIYVKKVEAALAARAGSRDLNRDSNSRARKLLFQHFLTPSQIGKLYTYELVALTQNDDTESPQPLAVDDKPWCTIL